MKVIVEKEPLAAALARAALVANRKASLSILGSVHLVAGGKNLTLEATDLSAAVSELVPAVVDGAMDLHVDARGLLQRVELFPPESAITLTQTDTHLKIAAKGRQSYSMLFGKGEDFPKLQAPPKGHSVKIDEGWVQRVKLALHSTSEDDKRAHLSSEAMFPIDGVVGVTSTDGHRMFRAGPCQGEPAVLLPLFACKLLAKLQTKFEWMAIGKSSVFFTGGGVTFSAKIPDAKAPPYDQVVPRIEEATFAARMSRDALVEAIRRVEVTGRVATMTNDAASLVLFARSVDGEEGWSSAGCSVVNGTLKRPVSFQASYMREAAEATAPNEDGTLEIRVVDDISPIRLDGDGTVAIVMPHRL